MRFVNYWPFFITLFTTPAMRPMRWHFVKQLFAPHIGKSICVQSGRYCEKSYCILGLGISVPIDEERS